MAILQYRCKKHPKLTRRGSHPDGTYQGGLWDGRVKYKDCIPKCPTCREPMERYNSREKGNKYRDGVGYEIDENFKKRLTWTIKKDKKK